MIRCWNYFEKAPLFSILILTGRKKDCVLFQSLNSTALRHQHQ